MSKVIYTQFFGGVIFFAIIANFIPEPSLAPTSDPKSKKVTNSIIPIYLYSLELIIRWCAVCIIATYDHDNRNMGMKGAKIS